MTCEPPLIPCFNRNDPNGINTCSITPDPTTTYNEKNIVYAIVDGNGYPIYNSSMKLGYSESSKQNRVGCIPNSLGRGSGSCYDDGGKIINGYKACTEAECKPVIYDNSFPLNQCNSSYVTIEGNYQPLATCTTDLSSACSTAPVCDPPCQNGGTCEFSPDMQPVCNCNTAVFTAVDCFASCRTQTPQGNTWTFRYSGDYCEIPPPDGLPDGFVTKMIWEHHVDGGETIVCSSYPFGRRCVDAETAGTENESGDCIAYGFYCGAETDKLDHSTGADQGNCNC